MMPRPPIHNVHAACALVLGLTLFVGCPASRGGGPGARRARVAGGAVDFDLETVKSGRVQLRSFKGKPLVVLFFTTACTLCQVQVARLQPVRAALGNKKIGVLGIALDRDRRLVPIFAEAGGFNFPVAYGKHSWVRESPFGPVRAVPAMVIFDAQGRAVASFMRPVTSKVLFKILRRLLD